MKNIATIILAAGEGTRMKSSLPKVLHNICGKPMLEYLIDNVKSIGIDKVIAIVGHKAGLVKKNIPGIKCITQTELLGTGDAVSRARSAIVKDNKIDNVLILYGDTPLLSAGIIEKLIERHVSTEAAVTLLTAQITAGWNIYKGHTPLPREIFICGLIAALFHDSGYIKERGDISGRGGKYTFRHEERSINNARVYLSKHFLCLLPWISKTK